MADPEEILRGIRHLRKRAARGDLVWIRERYDAGKLRFLRKLLPEGGYARLGRELADDDVLGVRASLASIDDDLIAVRYEADEPVGAGATAIGGARSALERDEPGDHPRLITISPDDDFGGDAPTSVFAPIDLRDDYESSYDEPVLFDSYGSQPNDFFADDDLEVVDDDYFAEQPSRTSRVVEPASRGRAVRGGAATGPARRAGGAGARTTGARAKPKMQWLYAGLVALVLFVLYLTKCTGGDDKKTQVSSTTSTSTVSSTTGPAVVPVVTPSSSVPVSSGATPGVSTTAPGNSTVPTITVPPNGAPFTILFQSGSATVDAAGQTAITQAAERIKAQKPTRVLIYGYASPEGNPATNNELSLRRARAVEALLKSALGTAVSPQIVVDAKTDATPDPDPAKVRRVTITLLT